MRIWSIHPKYLDSKGLVALWRETLLAKNVLENKTRGYKNHPQLNRFKNAKHPCDSINQYLSGVYKEAVYRNYNFDKSKINFDFKKSQLPVNSAQVEYEFEHLLWKLKTRDITRFRGLHQLKSIEPHPIFKIIIGAIESWEVITG